MLPLGEVLRLFQPLWWRGAESSGSSSDPMGFSSKTPSAFHLFGPLMSNQYIICGQLCAPQIAHASLTRLPLSFQESTGCRLHAKRAGATPAKTARGSPLTPPHSITQGASAALDASQMIRLWRVPVVKMWGICEKKYPSESLDVQKYLLFHPYSILDALFIEGCILV